MTDAGDANDLVRRRAQWHAGCFGCRPTSDGGLGLRFETLPDGSVVSKFNCSAQYRGYSAWVHGGIVATLLYEAMTECLVNLGVRGITARLNIRYRRPVDVGVEAVVQARLVRADGPLYVVHAELRQNGKIRALADAKFYGQSPADAAAGVIPGYFAVADAQEGGRNGAGGD